MWVRRAFKPFRWARPSVCFGSSNTPRTFCTYTPFTLGVLRGAWGWTLLGLIWGLAAAGVVLKTINRMSHPIASTGRYLLMGWLILIAVEPLTARVPAAGLLWLVAGGVTYTVGVIFFATDSRLRYGHFI